jgi:hypothetical protein
MKRPILTGWGWKDYACAAAHNVSRNAARKYLDMTAM